jgi:hypothetical protein
MTTETLAYVEAVNGRPWTQDDQSSKDFDYLFRLLPIDLDRDLIDPLEAFLFEPYGDDWMTEFGKFLEREYPITPCIDVAY